MTDKSFDIRIDVDVIKFLKEIGLFKNSIYDPNDHYADIVKSVSRKRNYEEIFQSVINTYSYDILLSDDSVFQFHKEKNNYRYCFIQNPRVKMSWDEYLFYLGENEVDITESERELFQATFDNDEDECFQINNYPVCIRYDVSEEEYKEGEHPYSHLHIGIHNEIRIPISILLTPEMFTEFVVKMVYRQMWLKFKDDNYFVDFHNSSKSRCDAIDLKFWSEMDKKDLFLK